MWHIKKWRYAMDPKHGFGILAVDDDSADTCPCFFEDGTYETVRKEDVDRESAVNDLQEDYRRREHRFNSQVIRVAGSIAAGGSCRSPPAEKAACGQFFLMEQKMEQKSSQSLSRETGIPSAHPAAAESPAAPISWLPAHLWTAGSGN